MCGDWPQAPYGEEIPMVALAVLLSLAAGQVVSENDTGDPPSDGPCDAPAFNPSPASPTAWGIVRTPVAGTAFASDCGNAGLDDFPEIRSVDIPSGGDKEYRYNFEVETHYPYQSYPEGAGQPSGPPPPYVRAEWPDVPIIKSDDAYFFGPKPDETERFHPHWDCKIDIPEIRRVVPPEEGCDLPEWPPEEPAPLAQCEIGLVSCKTWFVTARLVRRHILHESADGTERRWEVCEGCGAHAYVVELYHHPSLNFLEPDAPPTYVPKKYEKSDWCD